MLAELIHGHLAAAGDEAGYLFEPFTPHEARTLVHQDGGLVLSSHTPLPVWQAQTREERFRLFQSHDDRDYVLKVMSMDTSQPGLIEYIRGRYKVIAVERRNALSAYLSALVSFEHNVWAIEPGERPEYHRFTVSEEIMNVIGTHITRYYTYLDRMNPDTVLYYEDVVADPKVALERCGLYHPGASIPEHRTAKNLSYKDKVSLIENVDEVVEHFMGIMTPYMPNLESNDL